MTITVEIKSGRGAEARAILTLDAAELSALHLMAETSPVRFPPDLRLRVETALQHAVSMVGGTTAIWGPLDRTQVFR